LAIGNWTVTLALVAGRAVLRFVVVHGHFEHVVAANAHPMDFYWRPLAWLRLRTVALGRRLMRGRWLMCLTHAAILTRPAKSETEAQRKPQRIRRSHFGRPESGSLAPAQKIENPCHDFTNLHRAVHHDAAVLSR